MNLRLLYLYLFSFVGLLIVVFGSIQLVNLGLKAYVFKGADTYEVYPISLPDGKPMETKEELLAKQERETARQRQRELVNSVSMLVVGTPLYLYHWRLIKKESKA